MLAVGRVHTTFQSLRVTLAPQMHRSQPHLLFFLAKFTGARAMQRQPSSSSINAHLITCEPDKLATFLLCKIYRGEELRGDMRSLEKSGALRVQRDLDPAGSDNEQRPLIHTPQPRTKNIL